MLARPLFRDRFHAGRELAVRLSALDALDGALVLALPRGGVPVGYEVAQALSADLDIFVVRKLGVPGHKELAMGAIASGGVRVLNQALIDELGLPDVTIDRIAAYEQHEIERRELLYREGRTPLPIGGRTAILVDDGLATGASMLAALRAVRARDPGRIIIGVPVASREAYEEFRGVADDIVCLKIPEPFMAVGAWYENFSQTSDAEVQELLRRAVGRAGLR